MPHRFPHEHDHHELPNGDLDFETDILPFPARNMWGRTWHKVENWLKKDEENQQGDVKDEQVDAWRDEKGTEKIMPVGRKVSALSRPTRNIARQNSEMRDRLCVYEPNAEERRAVSVGRRTPSKSSQVRSLSPPPYSLQPSYSAPDISQIPSYYDATVPTLTNQEKQYTCSTMENDWKDNLMETNTLEDTGAELGAPESAVSLVGDDELQFNIQDELEAKWILNLSMHFKDHSDREKFFITYAEQANKWRRVTISIDYRDPGEESLESDLKALRYQRDKSARIYESIRDSLLDIKFYPTVTNLKLKTSSGRLHVHCSEDLNEIIPYPKLSMLHYLPFPVYKDADVLFESHISGFVYKVVVDGRIMVKKEIPGPESVDEFLYEITALSSLRRCDHVVNFEGLVVDDSMTNVKGLLITLASKGALVDIIYDERQSGQFLPWSRRENWARQIIRGLSEVHESGFVQGDFTLSNIVADHEDNVWLIDINRRGCPVGWEPPELETLIRAGQHISMFIGVKTDLFQLGMVLWALANCVDEPERESRPLPAVSRPDVPEYYRRIVEICLQDDPRNRRSALDLLDLFPPLSELVLDRADPFDHVQISQPVLKAETDPSYVEDCASLTIKTDLHDPGLSNASQISEFSGPSSILKNEPNAAGLREYTIDPSDLRTQLPNHSSTLSQSDCDRPLTRDGPGMKSILNTTAAAKNEPLDAMNPDKSPESTLAILGDETVALPTYEPHVSISNLSSSVNDSHYVSDCEAPAISAEPFSVPIIGKHHDYAPQSGP